MKDYFDLRALAREGAVGQEVLADAIGATFGRRGTALPAEPPLGLTDEYAQNAENRAQWRRSWARTAWKLQRWTR